MGLVGMGSGKSTIGEAAASEWPVLRHRPHGRRGGLPVSAGAIGRRGRGGIPASGAKAVAAVPDSRCISAAGGGAVLSEQNGDHMRKGAPVVWLRCRPETLAERVGGLGRRPLLDGVGPVADRLSEILAGRARLYEEVATDVVDTDARDIADVVSEVVEIWGN